MARNLSPQLKRARRLKIATTDKQLKILTRRPSPPGVHGPDGHRRMSEYGKQLQEKQKAKFIYGIMERQFANYVTKALKAKGDNGFNLFNALERRMDNAVYRAGLATTRQMARQMVSHGFFKIDGKKVDIPSYKVSVGEVITVREKSEKSPIFNKIREQYKNREHASWLHGDIDKLTFKVTDEPKTSDMTGEFDPKLIIEFYSK